MKGFRVTWLGIAALLPRNLFIFYKSSWDFFPLYLTIMQVWQCSRKEKRCLLFYLKKLFLGNSLYFCSAKPWWNRCLWTTTTAAHTGGKRHTTKMGSLAAAWGRTLVPFKKEWARLWRLSIGELRASPGLSKPSSAFLEVDKGSIK